MQTNVWLGHHNEELDFEHWEENISYSKNFIVKMYEHEF